MMCSRYQPENGKHNYSETEKKQRKKESTNDISYILHAGETYTSRVSFFAVVAVAAVMYDISDNDDSSGGNNN